MVCFVNVHSVYRIIYSIFQRFNLGWKNHTLRVLANSLDVTPDQNQSKLVLAFDCERWLD